MQRKIPTLPALFACSLVAVFPAGQMVAQDAAPAPAAPAAPATLNRLFTEAEAAFTAKEYDTAVAKIQELLQALGGNKEAPLELLYFNIGLGYLLGDKPVEAEAAFADCIKRFPKGEYTSRSYLGLGRSCILQGTPEKMEAAINPLKTAAQDVQIRSEAGFYLGQVYSELDRTEEALTVFRSLMGSDIRSPQQTTAAVEVIALLASTGNIPDLVAYLDRLGNQAGVRDAIAWYANQVVVSADDLVGKQSFEAALAIYRSVPPRNQIIETQKIALDSQRRAVKILETRVESEKNKPLNQRSNASEFLNVLKPAMEVAEKALATIEEKKDLDAALLMRRGRCLYYLDRSEEALVCFRTIRNKYGDAADAMAAAYAEIVLLNKLKNVAEIKVLCDAFLRKYPDSPNAEQVATLSGEVLVQSGDWAEVGSFYRSLESRFPKSESLDRYVFFQGVALFQDLKYPEAIPVFDRISKDFPNSPMVENAMYYVAMCQFMTNNYKETLAACTAYLNKFPEGNFAGDMRYRLAFIDFNDKETDQTDKIIKNLSDFLKEHPEDAAAASMYCLIGDSWKKKKSKNLDEIAKYEREALEAYKKGVWTANTDEVISYALDAATNILQAKKDWAGVAELHGEFLKQKPESPMALVSASWVARMKVREGKGSEAAEMLAVALKPRIGNPESEQVEFLIDELVRTLVPRKKPADIDADAIDAQLVEIITKAVGEQENATSNARLYYARAQLARMLKRPDRAELYLKGIATINAKEPAVLSPALLAVSGDILLKMDDLDGAEGMFKRLSDRYKQGMFSDAGPVGLGYVALKRKQPEEALKIFSDALETNPGMSRFRETTIGKMQALLETGKLEDAKKLALATVGDKAFRGEFAGRAYLVLGQVYRAQAEKESGVDARIELLKQAHATYQRVYVAYQGVPEVCAEAYWQAAETAKQLGNSELEKETIKMLAEHPKLKNTERAKQAAALVK